MFTLSASTGRIRTPTQTDGFIHAPRLIISFETLLFYNQRDISFNLADKNSQVSQQGVMFDQQDETRSPVIKDTG